MTDTPGLEAVITRLTQLSDGLRTRPAAAREIVDLISRVPTGALDEVLDEVDLPRLMESARGLRWRHHGELAQLLLVRRSEELSDRVLADTIGAVHRGRTSREGQEAIVEALCSLHGDRFNEVKYLLNGTGDRHDLERLVFDDLDEDLQDRLLEHIAEESGSRRRPELRVLCDIDDTLQSAIHEDRYPRHRYYPGAVTLLTALDDGACAERGRPGDLTFVTARPGGPADLVERYTRGGLEHLGLPPHTIMGGSLLNLHTHAAIAERKLSNMDRDRHLFPECRMVFIGDSGQADGRVGAEMYRRDPEHMVGTLLHNVTDLDAEARAGWAELGVHVFDTYAGAAAHALRLRLISVDQARRVAVEVRAGLEVLDLTAEQRARLEELLATDEAAIEALAGAGAETTSGGCTGQVGE